MNAPPKSSQLFDAAIDHAVLAAELVVEVGQALAQTGGAQAVSADAGQGNTDGQHVSDSNAGIGNDTGQAQASNGGGAHGAGNSTAAGLGNATHAGSAFRPASPSSSPSRPGTPAPAPRSHTQVPFRLHNEANAVPVSDWQSLYRPLNEPARPLAAGVPDEDGDKAFDDEPLPTVAPVLLSDEPDAVGNASGARAVIPISTAH